VHRIPEIQTKPSTPQFLPRSFDYEEGEVVVVVVCISLGWARSYEEVRGLDGRRTIELATPLGALPMSEWPGPPSLPNVNFCSGAGTMLMECSERTAQPSFRVRAIDRDQ
jgi:hypothetical protein